MKTAEWILILVSLVAIATCVFAGDRGDLYCQDPRTGQMVLCGHTEDQLADNGLPVSPHDETQFYVMQPDGKKFLPVAEAQQQTDLFYVRFSFPLNHYIWVTGHDPRPVTPGSKVQGKRLGLPATDADRRGFNWYRLKDTWTEWKKVTDLNRPVIYRQEWDGTNVVGETYPDDWQTYGGELDGQPTKPGCTLVPNPPTVKANQPLLLHLSLDGQVTAATITGQKVNLIHEHGSSYAELMLLPPTPGFFTASATIRGPNGEGTCEVPYAVDPPDPH